MRRFKRERYYLSNSILKSLRRAMVANSYTPTTLSNVKGNKSSMEWEQELDNLIEYMDYLVNETDY